MIALSPSTIKRLDRWLETDPDRFERYLRKHPEVADVYENMNTLSDHVRSAFTSAVNAPIDLAERLFDRSAEQSDTSEGAVMLDLFGVGFATLKTLFLDPETPSVSPGSRPGTAKPAKTLP